MKACYKLVVWFWWGWSSIVKVPKIASLQCINKVKKKKVQDQVDILHADKHQSFPKLYSYTFGIKVSYKFDIIIINGHDQAFSNYSKLQVCNMFTTSQKRIKECR